MMPAGPAPCTTLAPSSLPSSHSSRSSRPRWFPAALQRERKLPAPPGACSRAQGSGMLQGTATQWRSAPPQREGSTGSELPSHWQGERGCPTGPCPSGLRGPSRPLSFQPPSSQVLRAHLAQGNGRGLRLSALLQKDKTKDTLKTLARGRENC